MIFMENRAVAFIRKNDSETNDVKRMTVNETRNSRNIKQVEYTILQAGISSGSDFFICDGTQWYLLYNMKVCGSYF